MANVNGTEINLMPTDGMRRKQKNIENGKKKVRAVVQMLQEQEQHKY